jgi:hypothetical protein
LDWVSGVQRAHDCHAHDTEYASDNKKFAHHLNSFTRYRWRGIRPKHRTAHWQKSQPLHLRCANTIGMSSSTLMVFFPGPPFDHHCCGNMPTKNFSPR